MSVAMIVTNCTFVSSSRFDMYTTVDATCSTSNVDSTFIEPSACAVPFGIRAVMSVAALPMPIWAPTQPLGVTRFGQSGNPDDLYREYEIDSDSIMAAPFAALGI